MSPTESNELSGLNESATPGRSELLDRLRANQTWDVLIIGGGATGLGCAVDAAARGYRTLLLERGDFACGTSSRSTKLIHGGVRYLRQGDLSLVRHALLERARLLENAAPLVRPLPFVIPARSLREKLWYGAGLKLYDLLAGARNIASSSLLDRAETLAALPGLRSEQVSGGVRYWDAQFDDARLAIALMRTATDLGATCLNYLPVSGLKKTAGRVQGATAHDAETGELFQLRARVVINATGVYADRVRCFDEPAAAPLLTHSQGIHLVVDADFLPDETALLVPETEDGRVVFAIPWFGKVLLGTTDTARTGLPADPLPFSEEVDFLLRTVAGVLARPPQRSDVRSSFAGLRPLLDPAHEADSGKQGKSAGLSREHAVVVSDSGLVTVTGGKWTTYRWMAEQVVDRAAVEAGLPSVPSRTHELGLNCAALPAGVEAMARFAIRHEAARTIEDILARRSRALFVDAKAAAASIEDVGRILAEELRLSPDQLAESLRAAKGSARRFLLT